MLFKRHITKEDFKESLFRENVIQIDCIRYRVDAGTGILKNEEIINFLKFKYKNLSSLITYHILSTGALLTLYDIHGRWVEYKGEYYKIDK